MYDLMDPQPPSPSGPSAPLEHRLDALGRALAAREPADPPVALIAALRTRRRRTLVARTGLALATAAALLAAAMLYIGTRPTPPPAPLPIANNPAPSSLTPTTLTRPAAPTLAYFNTQLNRNATADTLGLSSSPSSSRTPAPDFFRASDAHNPDSVARLVDTLR